MSLGTNYTFYPAVRQGYRPDDEHSAGGAIPGSTTVGVDLTVRGSGDGSTTETASIDLRLFGPGDVTGLDNRQVVRTEPERDATSFPPNYFPVVEFDRPDLPWLFSPTQADDAGKNRPWLCLVAVKIGLDSVTFTPAGLGPLPVLEAPVTELSEQLPDQSWAWAHAQVAGAPPSDLSELFGEAQNRTVSRLVCPRNLEGDSRYRACVVPTFERGRLTGLGRDPDEAGRGLAWDPNVGDSVRLPVYFYWDFSTSSEGDFESLVRELDPVDLGPEVGYRTIDVSNPGPEDLKLAYEEVADGGDTGTVGMGGALRSADPVSDPYENVEAMRDLLNRPADVVADTEYGAVGPPLYGKWHAGVPRLDESHGDFYPQWFNTLNPDPRYRIPAGLGAEVIRRHQDELMASAWEQFDDLDIANDWMKRAQLARDSMQPRHETMEAMSSGEVLAFTAPVHSEIKTADVVDGRSQTLKGLLEGSEVATELTTSTFRRLTRSRGDLARRREVEVSQSEITTAVEQGTAPKLRKTAFEFTSETAMAADGGERIADEGQMAATESSSWQGLRVAAAETDSEVGAQLRQRGRIDDLGGGEDGPWGGGDIDDLKPRPGGSMDAVTDSALLDLDPAIGTPRFIADKLSVDLEQLLAGQRDDPVEEVLAYPTFTEPMYKALIELDQRYLLPGVGDIPKNSVGAVVTNPEFIEAFMVGLNHEMARELRWRRFPTDRRGTYFKWFWERPATDGGPPPADIEDVHEWDLNDLGGNSPGETDTAKVVVLVRGELLRRYPNTLVYATKAVEEPTDGDRIPFTQLGDWVDDVITSEHAASNDYIQFPVFRGTLNPDVTFFGFDLSHDDAVNESGGDADGWFFVFEEPPGAEETRFGLDVNDGDIDSVPPGVTHEEDGSTTTEPVPDGAEHGWSALSWGHLADPGATEVEQGAYVDVIGSPPGSNDWRVEASTPDIEDHEAAEWGKNSAHMARITFQQPVRVGIHADDLLPDPGGNAG